jgi:hypothetical protein
VRINCTLTTDLSQLPQSYFKQKTRASDGAPYANIGYDLQIKIGASGLMRFSLLIGGTEYSAVDVTF